MRKALTKFSGNLSLPIVLSSNVLGKLTSKLRTEEQSSYFFEASDIGRFP